MVTSVTPFGNVGPYRDFLADELIINALGGFIYGVGEPDREPLGGQGVQSQILAGACANAATLAALFARRKDGRGQQVDISVQEVTATLLEAALTIASYTGWTWRRSGKRRAVAYHPIYNYSCRNGYINISILEDREWRSFCDLIGCKELAEDPRFATSRERLERADEVDALLANWLSARDSEEIYRVAQAHRLACGPVSTVPDLLASPHLGARGFFSVVPLDGREMAVTAPPFIMSDEPKPFTEDDCEPTSMADAGVAFMGDQPSTDRPLPLAAIRVLDCTHSWAGPLATQFTAYFGAEVIHVESLRHPDRWRGPVTSSQDSRFTYRYPHHEPGHRPYNRNALFNELNTGKLAIALDLTDPRGQETFAALVRQSDAVVTNFSVGAIHKLGLDHDSLTAIKPAIISLSLTGLGGTGPDKGFLAWGTTIEALSGLANRQGYLGGPPLLSNMAYGDPVAGIFGGVALLTALWHKQRTGVGQHIDLSLLECSTTLLLDATADYSYDGTDHGRQGNRHADYAPRGCYPCAGEDRWIAISVISDDQWRRLCCAMGRQSWADDPRFATPKGRHVHHDNLD